MPSINQLSAVDSLSPGDAFPIYSQGQGDARRSSFTVLVQFLSSAFTSLTVFSFIKVKPVLVAALPSAATAGVGAQAFVTDASATTFASTVAGGGSNRVPVYSDGANWKIG